jgi:hypothetical protein
MLSPATRSWLMVDRLGVPLAPGQKPIEEEEEGFDPTRAKFL